MSAPLAPQTTPQIRVAFDWGSGICLWSANKAAETRFGDYPIETRALGLPEDLTQAGEDLITRFDQSLNWDDPGGPSLWGAAQWAAFEQDAAAWLSRVRAATGDAMIFIDGIRPK